MLKQSKLKQMLELCYKEGKLKMEVESYLIKPLQRICKYPLLLQELIKVTPYTSNEHAKLLQIEHKIRDIVTEINETQRRLDTLAKLTEIQAILTDKKLGINVLNSNCYVMKDGHMSILNNNMKIEKIYLYLLNDMLIITEDKEKRVLLDVLFNLQTIDFIELNGFIYVKFIINLIGIENGFQVVAVNSNQKQNMYRFVASSLLNRELWMKEIQQHILNKKHTKNFNKTEQILNIEQKRKKEEKNSGFFKKFKF